MGMVMVKSRKEVETAGWLLGMWVGEVRLLQGFDRVLLGVLIIRFRGVRSGDGFAFERIEIGCIGLSCLGFDLVVLV